MQLSPEDQERVFGKDKLKTAYLKKKRSLTLNRRATRDYITSMSEEKDDLKSIKVYKFDNTKEKLNEFALKFRVIADTRDYRGIIDGSVVPPDELAVITITAEDTGAVLKEKKEKLKARKANKIWYRDLVMSTEGISFTIVENAVSEELPSGDLKKAWERLERRWNPKTREDKVEVYTKFLNYKLENTRQRPMDWIAFLVKNVNPNRDSPNGYPTVTPTELQPVTLAVGSHQVSFLMCTLETLQKYCSTSSLLLTSVYLYFEPSQSELSSNYELFMYFCFCSFFHSYGSFNRDIFNILDLLWVSSTLFIHIFTLFMYRK